MSDLLLALECHYVAHQNPLFKFATASEGMSRGRLRDEQEEEEQADEVPDSDFQSGTEDPLDQCLLRLLLHSL